MVSSVNESGGAQHGSCLDGARRSEWRARIAETLDETLGREVAQMPAEGGLAQAQAFAELGLADRLLAEDRAQNLEALGRAQRPKKEVRPARHLVSKYADICILGWYDRGLGTGDLGSDPSDCPCRRTGVLSLKREQHAR